MTNSIEFTELIQTLITKSMLACHALKKTQELQRVLSIAYTHTSDKNFLQVGRLGGGEEKISQTPP